MAAQVQPLPGISAAEREERRYMVNSALGTTLAEGVSPSPDVLALTERYVEGELSLEELGKAVRDKYAR